MKSKLRHPIRSVTEPYGKAGLLVAILALVLATTGAALAAGGLSKPQEKQVIKIAKKFAGKPGAPGTNGTNGPAGPTGAEGPPGANGKNGTSVTSTPIAANPSNANCKEGGSEFKAGASTTYACNGSPWTAGGTLPSKATETGAYSFVHDGATGHEVTPVSFPVPLAESLKYFSKAQEEAEPKDLNQVHVIGPSGEEIREKKSEPQPHNACPGTAAEPKAEPGNFCVYLLGAGGNANPTHWEGVYSAATFTPGSARTGLLLVLGEAPSGSLEAGTWAVTAP